MAYNDGKKKLAETENTKMFRSRFDIFVLNALNDKDGASYGYDVINYIQRKTKGHYKVKTYSTIYNTLKRLEEQNYVISGKGDGESNGAQRVYYTLTPEGRHYLDNNKQEYKYLRTLLDNLLTSEDFDLDNDEAPYMANELKPLTKRTKSEAINDDDENNIPVADLVVSEIDMETPKIDIATIPSSIESSIKNDSQFCVKSSQTELKDKSHSYTKKINSGNEYKFIFEKITAPVVNSSTKNITKSKSKPIASSVSSQEKTINRDNKVQINNTPLIQDMQKESVKKTIIDESFEDKKTNIDKFKNDLRSEGFLLSTYNNASSTSQVKYLYINRIIRDSVVLSVLYSIIMVLMLFLLRKTFDFSLTALLTCGGIALGIALAFALIWFRNPDKRRKDNINLKVINAGAIGFFTVFFMLDLIITLLIPNEKGLNTPSTYSPVIIATTSIFFGLIFTVLYKSNNYFQK